MQRLLLARSVFTLAFVLAGSALFGQDSRVPQFHGFAVDSFLYSNDNNYLGMHTTSGAFDWTEAALNVNEQLLPNLRVGAQAHTTRLGAFGSWVPELDWAMIDYRAKPWLGIRAGKVKIRWGLYNDTQDADPGYLWSLLPEPMYAVDWRATDLAQNGVELYGRLRLGRRRGSLEYSAYYGFYAYAANDGTLEGFREDGLAFTKRPSGITPGFDLRWKTPLRGLVAGGSLMLYNASGNLVNGAFRESLTYWPTYYAQYEKNRLSLSAQFMTLNQPQIVTTTGAPQASTSSDRAWFAMASYHVTDRFQAGAYYTRNTVLHADASDPGNYFRDWVLSGRYDLNRYFYLKLEGHFIHGTGLGFYDFDNPNGLEPSTKLLVAKIGFFF